MNKYVKVFKSGFFQQLNDRAQLFGRLILFTVIVYLFYQVFESVRASQERLWYYVMTEAIILATPALVLQVAGDIRSQQILYFLLKPINYCTFRTSEAMGTAIFRFCCLICFGIGYSMLLKGPGFITVFSTIQAILAGILGIFLYTQISLLIGLSSYWLKDVKTILYLNLTATFCFGGLIVPISFYPSLMQTICFCTPYPWILWWPAAIFTGDEINYFYAFASISFWIVLVSAINRLLFHRYRQALVTEGG